MTESLTRGQRIRKKRLDCRYTQEYVAAQLGTTKQAIYKYEADLIKSIPTDKLLRLSQLFHCSPAWLLTLSDEEGTPADSTMEPVEAPCGTPHRTKRDAALEPDAQFTYYRDLMDVMLHLTTAERQTLLQFAQFMASQHEAERAEALAETEEG